MSFLKFWKGRPKAATRGGFSEDSEHTQSGAMADQGEYEDAETDKRGRLKHSLSISRSGRYKAKKKERTGFLDKPDIFDGPESESSHSKSTSEGASHSTSHQGSHRRNSSNPSSCRDGTQITSLGLKHPQGIPSQPTAV